jgi:hypothetical protein
MKTQIKIILLFVAVAASACNNNLYSEKDVNSLEGSWELRSIKGGFRQPRAPSDFEPGNGTVIKFDGDKFEMTDKKNSSVSSGTFTIVSEPKIINGDEVAQKIVYLEDNNQTNQYFKLSGDKLVLYFGEIASDGYEATYEKL